MQSARQPEESATAGTGATATLPGQYKQRTPMYNAGTTANPATPTSPSTPASTPANNGPPAAATASQPETPTQPPSTPQTPTPTPAPTPPQPQPKKNLSLTVSFKNLWRVVHLQNYSVPLYITLFCGSAPQRDQMYAAQEMFKTANKVTRPEKALILGFMAGSRGTGVVLLTARTKTVFYKHTYLVITCLLPFCREPMSGAGGHHPDQAERTHRGSAQSGRHRQHHHAGGHGFRNELLHRTVDPPQEIQTHHKYLLRHFTSLRPHPQNFLSTSKNKKHVYTYKYSYTFIWAKSKHLEAERWSRRERSSLFLQRQNCRTWKKMFVLFSRFIVSVFTPPPHFPERLRGQRRRADGCGTINICTETQACKKRRAVCILLYKCDV